MAAERFMPLVIVYPGILVVQFYALGRSARVAFPFTTPYIMIGRTHIGDKHIMSESIYEVPVRHIDGKETTLGAFRGKVMLVVNVASACGLTPQYSALEKLYEEKRAQGFIVAGFPANEFGAQEPGTNQEIADFCSTKFGVKFPMFEKIVVKGQGVHPLYRLLIQAQPRAQEKPGSDFRAKLASYGIKQEKAEDVMWNFEKFLVSRDGRVVGRFAPDTAPDDALLKDAVERELASV
jgi:glutathione peroxidase